MHLPTTQLAGFYKLTKYKNGLIIEDRPWTKNLILDTMLNDLSGALGLYGTYNIRLGTSNVKPQVTDLKLGNEVGKKNYQTSASVYNYDENYIAHRFNVRFMQGEIKDKATGSLNNNIAELGFGMGDNLLSRALVLDANNQPSSIAVLADEVLDVTWEMRTYYDPAFEKTGVLTLAGNVGGVHNYHIKPFALAHKGAPYFDDCTNYRGARSYYYNNITALLPTEQKSISQSYLELQDHKRDGVYVNNSFTNSNYVFFNATKALNNISFIHYKINNLYQYQILIDPPITKTDEQTLRLEFEHKIGRKD